MTSTNDEADPSEDRGISDDELPEDLRPDENPLADGLEDGETAGDLLEEGKDADESEDEERG